MVYIRNSKEVGWEYLCKTEKKENRWQKNIMGRFGLRIFWKTTVLMMKTMTM